MKVNDINALAAVAVSGAALAEVTITGSVAYGYQATKSNTDAVAAVNGIGSDVNEYAAGATLPLGVTMVVPAVAAVDAATGVKASGFGVDTAAITVAASEDLGGGMKVSGSMSLGGITRGDTPTGEDFKMSLSGGFGTILLGQIEIGSGIRALGTAGAPVNNMEGEVLDAASAGTDIIKYTAPKMGAITLSGSLTETKGLATGMSTGQTSAVTVGAVYAANGLTASLDTTDWNNNASSYDSRFRVAAKYDLGYVAFGAGLENIELVGTGTTKLTVLGVSAPMGALTVGASTVSRDTTGNVKLTGYTVGASYALSKRTSLTANTASWKVDEATAVAQTKTTVLLNHSF